MELKIQKVYRGYITRVKRLPLIMYSIQRYLIAVAFQFSNQTEDGRINSCMDEVAIIQLLIQRFKIKIKIPKIRMWYDILAFDSIYGWIPINIKTTTMMTSDNTGNLAMCVQAYTNVILDYDKSYDNGKMSVLLFDQLKDKCYNNIKRDYYFIVLNKLDSRDVVVNSVKGLSVLTPNINNLPFQVCWNKNRVFNYEPTRIRVQQFIECLQKPRPSWKETFMMNIRSV